MRVLGFVLALLAWTLAATVAWAEEGRWQKLENNPGCFVWNAYPQPNETVTWSGACVDRMAQGRGAQVWRYLEDKEWKESKYTGEMKDGKKHGYGVLMWADGGRYEGEWKDGKEHGHGVMVWGPDTEWAGDRYEGGMENGKTHGRGTYYFANGDKCEGGWKDNSLSGTGKGWTEGRETTCYLDGDTIKFSD